ncbi:two-component regulator propeller domain-containing protein [Marinoscillum sp. MHG1-6]|uniref:hybrid sensor histidine kinase/response regulator transcription factor n=1 Tax=Marinoscillum sp. MHG1-6 TaxID=2959627 RepID=UPI00215869B7|nr:two-component regulator propeller domain-containing protein [Marinoscillum sp. MHG1-6]
MDFVIHNLVRFVMMLPPVKNLLNLIKSRSFLIAIVWLCFVQGLYAQGNQARFHHLTTDDGLSQNMVDCMLQDSQGFMWLGTWNGLCRYDGYEFELFNEKESPPYSLRSNFIYALHEDGFGNIWVGTGEGLYLYIYDQHKFLPVELNAEISSDLDYKVIAPIGENKLIISAGQSLNLIRVVNKAGDFELLKYVDLTDLDDAYEGANINAALISDDIIWVGTDKGLLTFGSEYDVKSEFNIANSGANGLVSDKIMTLYESSEGEIWIGAEFGLYRFNVAEGNFQGYFNGPDLANSLPHNSIMDIDENSDKKLVIATLGGLSFLDQNNAVFENHVNGSNQANGLNNNFINCLLYDRNENLWIGTERGGVNILHTEQNIFEEFVQMPDNQFGLSSNTVNSIFEDEKYIWIGTAGGGLNRYNKRKNKYNHFKYNVQNESTISSDFITSIHKSKVSGTLWAGSWGGGLNLLTAGEVGDRGFQRVNEQNSDLISGYISSIVEDAKGNIWIGTLGGISVYSQEKGSIDGAYLPQKASRVTAVGCMAFDNSGDLWIGTQVGLFRFQLKGDDLIRVDEYRNDPENPESISGDYVISLLKDSNGNMWAGTYGQGLNRVNVSGDTVSFTKFNTNDGISNNIIYGIVEDKVGQLWLSTDYGLSRFDPDTNQMRNFFRSDGLLNNQYYWSAAYKSKDGKLYFGGMRGMNAFYPDQIKEYHVSPVVTLTDLKLIEGSVLPGLEYNGAQVLDQNISRTKGIELSYMEKMLSIEFSTLNFIDPELVHYAYKLEGFDKNWNYVGANRHYASYTNLRPGHYTFMVKGAGSDGVYSEEPTELMIVIHPPFWQTIWFQSLCVALLLMIILGYVRFRTYQLKRQKDELEMQVAERTKEINDQKEALSYQAIQLQKSNFELEHKQKQIEGQNELLETQNKEILDQRDELIELNKRVKLVSQLRLGFFTNISHEFRTPLTLILGPLDRLIKKYTLPEDVKGTLELMNRNAQRLLNLINQIMDFRKIEKGKMELQVGVGDVEAFCRELFEAFQPLAEIKQIDFSLEVGALPGEVWFDKQKMENILYNLLSNAFKYTPHEGKIKMEVMALSGEESKLNDAGLDIEEVRNVVSIKIIDSGSGISEENLPLIFKRFYRIESENAFKISGSGVGLALTEELIKTHHGDIFVSSEVGVGSIFEIQFPCLKGAYELQELGESSGENDLMGQVELLKSEFLIQEEAEISKDEDFVPDTSKRTILVVEDNVDLRKFITHRLTDLYNVIEAGDGERGVEFAERYNPDIIVSDVMMPKMDGFELLASIKNNFSTSHIPVVLLTAKASVENQIEGIQIGADDYLPKPFNFDLLEVKIASILANRDRIKVQYMSGDTSDVRPLVNNNKDLKFLESAVNIVNEQMSNSDFGSKDLILALGISRSLLHKKLTALTNQSAVEFINQLRMKKAKELLCDSEMNISSAAYAVGYNDPKYFSRLFSKHFNESPKDYQKRMLEHLDEK